MVLSLSQIPAADYFINRDPWLRRLGGRQAGKRISEQLYECCPPILRGRPIYDRLPGAAEAYNKDTNTFISQGTIILPEAKTIISSAEDVYFRERFPELYTDRDYITGSQLGPGSAAALFEDSRQAVKQGDGATNRNILIRSGIFLYADDIVRDSTEIAKQTIEFPGMVIQLPQNGSGWLWIDGMGNLNVTEALPDGAANLSGNIWCDPNAIIGEPACVRRVTIFQRDEGLIDKFDRGDSEIEQTWPPTEECEVATFSEVSLLFRFIVNDGILTVWEDYRRFNRTFDLPVARWLMDYWDNFLQEKREQIDTFIDDGLVPDTVGYNFIPCDATLRQDYKTQTFDQIIDAWDFGLINRNTIQNVFSFLSAQDLAELRLYDDLTNSWLDWLAQHFGFQDNGTAVNNYWHSGSWRDGNNAQDRVYYTIMEKRAILRNALGQDPFQTLVDAGNFEFDFPIWNIFAELWGFTETFWNSGALVPTGETEFIFTRFPFTTYNRLKPESWHGLLKAKGTLQGIYFMFDVLGLHGYACTQNLPRFYDVAADFETPLIPLKPVNSAVIDTIKTLDGNGNIVEVLDDFGDPTYRIGNYASTGYVQTGLTSFSDGYDTKLVVRAPFSWTRDSQKWLRLQEIANTYVNDGQLVTGYYHFITGQSAANEPVWLPEICTACEYVVTSELFETSSFYGSDDENIGSEFSWVQNMVGADNWNNVGFERGSDLAYNLITYPTYVENRTILAIYSEGINDTEPRRDNANDEFPVVASYDNGITFEPIVTDFDNANAISPIKFANRLRHFAGNTFIVANDTILFSQDAGVNWFGFDTQGTSGQFLDVFPDRDTRRIYLVTDEALYHKFDFEPAFVKYHDLILSAGEIVSDAVVRYLDDFVTVAYIVTDPGNNIRLKIIGTQDSGENIFLLYSEQIDITTNVGIIKLRESSITTPNLNFNHFYFYSDGVNELFITGETLTTVTDNSQVFAAIYAQATLDFPGYSAFETTDIKFNTQNGRLEFLVTITDGTLQDFGAIYSLNIELDETPVLERSQINLIDNETKTGEFIIKRLQTPDIDAAPVDEPIDFVETSVYTPYSSDPAIPKSLFYYGVDTFNVPMTCIDTTHSLYPTTFFAKEDDKRNIVAINPSNYLSGVTDFNYDIPALENDVGALVTNENIIDTVTTPEFQPSDETWSILQIECNEEPFDVETVFYPRIIPTPPPLSLGGGGPYYSFEEIRSIESLKLKIEGNTETDTKNVFVNVTPYFGYYINNYYITGGLWENSKTVTFANHIPPDVNDEPIIGFTDAGNVVIDTVYVMSPHESLLGTEILITDSTPASMTVAVPNIDTINENINIIIVVDYILSGNVVKKVAFRFHYEPSTGGP